MKEELLAGASPAVRQRVAAELRRLLAIVEPVPPTPERIAVDEIAALLERAVDHVELLQLRIRA